MFGATAFVISKADSAKPPLISYLAVGFAGLMSVMRFVVPNLVVNSTKSKYSAEDEQMKKGLLAQLYMTKTVIGMAFLEGAAFFNLTAYMLDGQVWSYAVVAFLLGLMAISFPSQGDFESWSEDIQRQWN